MIRRSGLISASLFLLTACWPYGFAGGGLPSNVRTVAVIPFDNHTPAPELPRELSDELRRQLRSRLGLRDAPENRATAVVRGIITRYDIDIPIAYSADRRQTSSARRKLQLTLDIEIVDQTNGKTLWQRKGLMAEGEYAESEEAQGRREALQRVVNDVIEGAQSQW